MTSSQEIGAIIKTLRKEKKLSQKQLSEKVFGNDTMHATISRLESGKHSKVHFNSVCITLEALGIDIFKLIKTQI
jgi:transcriptional regulator with XRE-family HTH domain